jgi:cob(I)alamin adenosyltransferase
VTRLYTKTGDAGETGLLRGGRVSKADPRVEAYGTVDELNACAGAAVVEARLALPEAHRDFVVGAVAACQDCLMRLAAELASGGRADERVTAADVAAIEAAIDEAQARTPAIEHFLVPGVTRAESAMHVARTVCRRAERLVVALPPGQAPAEGVRYLNRLSDLLFALARVCVAAEGCEEKVWAR